MPQYIDSPAPFRMGKKPRRLLILAAILLVILLFGRTALSEWVDLLWFQSLGYESVLWKTLGLETGVFLVSTVVTFLLLYGAFYVMRRSHQADLPSTHSIVIAGRPVSLPVAPALRLISFGV